MHEGDGAAGHGEEDGAILGDAGLATGGDEALRREEEAEAEGSVCVPGTTARHPFSGVQASSAMKARTRDSGSVGR
ncbi:MAG: hypothetical protein R3B70_24010 [Polyangiaceae bacterium]